VNMNNTVKPFDDINIRKAVVAGFDRNAMRLVRGGELVGDIPTHMLPPGLPGFEEAGGLKGPGLDFMSHPEGDMALAAEYMKKAGYPSGKYTGGDTLLMIGTSEGVAEKAALVAKENFEKMGFKINLKLVTQDAMYTKFCNSPPAKVVICPNVGWLKDFSDAQTYLDPTFNGANILQTGNSNWSQLDDAELNKQMDDAKLITDPQERADAREELGRRRVLGELAALPHHRDVVAHLDRLVDVVGHEDDRLADLALEPQELVLEPLAVDRIDRAEGLVHQHQRRVHRQRARHPHALALAAGELRRIAAAGLARIEAHELEQLVDPLADALLVPAEQARDGADVVRDAQVGEQPDLLDRVSDLSPEVSRPAVPDALAVEQDVA